jgi:endonuclease YncB( thermonuclease family)
VSKTLDIVSGAFEKMADILNVPVPAEKVPSKFPVIPDQVQVYYANEPRVVDGDTCFMKVIGWGGNDPELKLRLSGIDSPEKRSLEGKQAESYIKVWFAARSTQHQEDRTTPYPYTVIITGPDKYQPRWNAIIYDSTTGQCLNQLLLDQGLATEYPKKKVT